jgi:hypothetical protein
MAENEKYVAGGAAEWDRQAEANRKIRERLSIDILLSSLGLDRDREHEVKEAAELDESEEIKRSAEPFLRYLREGER